MEFTETYYGRTKLGQLLYDLGFTNLGVQYLARKHKIPVSEIRSLRATALAALQPKKKRK